MSNKDVKIGIQLHYAADLLSAVQNACNSGYQFVVASMIHPRSNQFTPYCDLTLNSTDWATLMVSQIRNYDLEHSLENIKNLEEEITYSIHLGVPALLFNCPNKPEGIIHLARVINSRVISNGNYQSIPQLWIEIPVQATEDMSKIWRNDVEESKHEDTWERWNLFRSLVQPDRRVSVALNLAGDLPDDIQVERWAGEPIKAIIIPTSMFLTNKKGYPVLSKSHQVFLRILMHKMARDVHIIIKGNKKHDEMRFYSQYIEHLKNTQMTTDSVSGFAKGYEDYLQIPLQPLMDNLESCTYEVFEKDPIKYAEYGKAILEALKTRETNDNIVIMVVGAGRGPLVQASLDAAKKCEKKVHIYAVEKNPNAVVTLRTLSKEQWGGENGLPYGKVEVIACDMREWNAPQKADLVISELLGSFGDNELSPECLDGVWSYVKDDAISIPESYTSFLSPIQSQRLYCEASMMREKDKPHFSSFETGYVVHIRNCYVIDAPKQLFKFQHKNLTLNPKDRDNKRFASLSFTSQVDTICHGFAGYFEAVLFKDITLSTVPSNHTKGMFSWFPIYFPVHSPLAIKKDETIQVNFWRLINKRQVWYEWAVTSPVFSSIHNPNGRSYSIGLL